MKPTDWALIRSMMNTAIDACEAMEAAGYAEHHRGIRVNDSGASVFDMVTSAWTIPEAMRYRIIRDRHDHQDDLPYVPEYARILTGMAQAASELVGGTVTPATAHQLQHLLNWYGQAVPELQAAIRGEGSVSCQTASP